MLKILWFCFFVGTVHDGNTEKTVGYILSDISVYNRGAIQRIRGFTTMRYIDFLLIYSPT